MQSDIENLHRQSLDTSHHGHPTVLSTIHSGQPGWPQIQIDPSFLAWAYNQRSISALARFLGIGHSTLRDELVHNNLIQAPLSNEPPSTAEPLLGDPLKHDDILEPELPIPTHLPGDLNHISAESHQTSLHHSAITNDELDELIICLRWHYTQAGIWMLDGMLQCLGHHVQYEWIRQSLLRIDPVWRVFERIRIHWRTYHVAGPNALWHHDGQHGNVFFNYGDDPSHWLQAV